MDVVFTVTPVFHGIVKKRSRLIVLMGIARYIQTRSTPMMTICIMGLIAAAFLAVPFTVQSATFTRDVSLGGVGEEIKLLQQILNTDSRTRVAVAGPGSPGNETTYFGTLTKNAVIRFQNVYATEILTPLNLLSGTGFVGSATRDKLNTLAHGRDLSTPVAEIFEGLFLRNLSLGNTGEDVRQLQIFLNVDPDTRVALTGLGSPGNETTYFGTLTKNAVAAFQEKYKTEILFPLNLSKGTGYLGESTRNKLNALFIAVSAALPSAASSTQDEVVTPVSTTDPAPIDTMPAENLPTESESTTSPESVSDPEAQPENVVFVESSDLLLSFPSSYEGPVGTNMELLGTGFTRENNTVHFGETYTITGISSPTGGQITFTIPSTIPLGKHPLFVTNTNGTSNDNLFFIVTDPTVPRPTIATSTPAKGFYGAEVTITGTGFTPTGNEIRTSYGIIENVASPDGTTLTFTIEPVPELSLTFGSSQGLNAEWQLWFYVVNERGTSEDPGTFILKL